MAIRPKSGGFQVDVTWQGQRAPRVTVPDKATAERLEAQFKADLMAGRPIDAGAVSKARVKATRGSTATMGQLYDYAMRRRWRGSKSERTAEVTARMCVDYLGWDRPVAEVTSEVASSMADEWAEQGSANATINRKLAALRVMLNYALEKGEIDVLPRWEQRKEYEGRLRYFSDDEERSLIDFFSDDQTFVDMLVLGLDTGFRYAEIVGLQVKDFSFSTGKLTTWETKGNRARSVPLTPRARAVAMRLRSGKRDFDPMIAKPYPSQRVSARMARWKAFEGLPAGDEACFHSTRHTCCSRLVQKGVPLPVVQKWMGHADINTTMRYAHLSPDSFDQAVQALTEWTTQPEKETT